jgi:hypothetical protein
MNDGMPLRIRAYLTLFLVAIEKHIAEIGQDLT